MSLENLQNAMYSYICKNAMFNKIIPFYSLATVIYGIYSLLYNIRLLHTMMNLVWVVGGIIYLISVLGLIISFAKNNMVPIMVLFALLCISHLIAAVGYLFQEYTGIKFAIQSFIDTLIYGYFAYIAMVRYNKSDGVMK